MKFVVALVCVFLMSGCAQKYYYNQKYPNTQQQAYYDRDELNCQAMSYQSMPPQQIQYNAQPQQGFMAGYVGGMNLGSAMKVDEMRGVIYRNCMVQAGWYEIPCQTCIP